MKKALMRYTRNHLIKTSIATATVIALAIPAAAAGAARTYPAMRVTAPAASSVVAGSAVALKSIAGSGTTATWTPARVTFEIDGVTVGTASVSSSVYSLSWNSTTVADGTHSVKATGYTSRGRAYASPSVSIKVQNAVVSISSPTPTTTTLPPTTTTTAPPATTTTTQPTTVPVSNPSSLDVNRYAGSLGVGQTGGPKTVTDAINDRANHRASLVRVEATVPYQSQWNYARYDTILTAAKNNGMQVMFLFDYTPQELFPVYNGVAVKSLSGSSAANVTIHSFPRDPALQDRWVSYAMALVNYSQTRYPGVLGAIEWGNEPNGWEFGSQRGQYPMTPASYASLLLKAQTALKAQYPGVVSVTGGTSPGTTSKLGGGTTGGPNDSYTSVSPATWVQGTTTHTGWYALLKAAGAMPGTHFDHINSHFYDTTINSPWSQPFDSLWSVWSGPQVWATEQSASSNPLDNKASTTEASQSTWWSANLDLWHGKGAKAGAWFAFCLYDRQTTDTFGYFGLKNGAGVPKAAFSVFAARNGRA
ncbi:MAG: hypothetical protein JHD40_02740 [Acidimicrobiia bacterium]|nr:hypothetical protein [Acidimicrobiia bacterium]